MENEKVGWPWDTQTIYLTNNLTRQHKSVHVMVMPNEDFVFAELLVSFVGVGSSAIGMIKTASDLVRVIRILSLLNNARNIIDKLKEVMPNSSVTLHPGERLNVYDAWFKNTERFTTPVTAAFEMFGGKTRTLIITDEDFKNTVKFNTAVHTEYTVTEKGVESPMHYWNGGHITSGLLSSMAPSLTAMGNDMLMAYRHNRGDRIFVAELKDGYWDHKDRGWINVDSSEAIAATTLQGNLALVARDHTGVQMYSLWQSDHAVPFDDHERYLGPDIQWKPSVTSMGDTIYAVGKHYPGNAVMWASRSAGGQIKNGNTLHNTNLPPTIQAFKGKLYVFYTRPNTLQLCMAVSSNNGDSWQEVSDHVGYTSAGVATTIYKDRMYVFYRDDRGNGVFYKWTDDGSSFHEPPERYFGFDVAGEPTVAAIPGKDEIMVAGILEAEKHLSDLEPPRSEAIIWTVLKPHEQT